MEYDYEDKPSKLKYVLAGAIIIIVILLLIGSFVSIMTWKAPAAGMVILSPTPTATPAPMIVITNASPSSSPAPDPSEDPDLNDYNYFKTHPANTTLAPRSGSPNYTIILDGDPALSNSVRIYGPTPTPTVTPTPTPDPMTREIHAPLSDSERSELPDGSMDSQTYYNITINGSTQTCIIAWDPDHSYGLYPYYHVGDHAVLELRFVSQYWKPIVNPQVELTIKHNVDGTWFNLPGMPQTWTEQATLEPSFFDEGRMIRTENPGSIVITKEFNIPNIPGMYLMQFYVYYDNVRAVGITKEVVIL